MEIAEDTVIEIAVLVNDDDPDGDSLVIKSVGAALGGQVRISDDKLIYTPKANYNGTDVFRYTIEDPDGLVDASTVSVTVNPVNDAPVAKNDASSTAEDKSTTIRVLQNDVDDDGDKLEITSLSTPENGTASLEDDAIVYTPKQNFNGVENLTYTVSDGATSDSANVTIRITAVNDAPSATNDSVAVKEDADAVTIDVLSNDSDPDNNTLSIVEVGDAANGTIAKVDGKLVYKPNTHFNGTERIRYTVSDGDLTDEGVVTVVVEAVADTPVVVNDTTSTGEDTAITINVLSNDSDPDSETLTVKEFSTPENGTVVNNNDSVTYIPKTNFSGTDSFTYVAVDEGGLTASGKVTVQVNAVNDAPNAVDDSAEIQEGRSCRGECSDQRHRCRE